MNLETVYERGERILNRIRNIIFLTNSEDRKEKIDEELESLWSGPLDNKTTELRSLATAICLLN